MSITLTAYEGRKILFNKHQFPREWGWARIQSLTQDANGIWTALYHFDKGSFRKPDITERTFTSEPLPWGRDVFFIEHVIQEVYVWLLDSGQWVFSEDKDIADYFHQETQHGNYYVVDLDENGKFVWNEDVGPTPARNYDPTEFDDDEWGRLTFVKPALFDKALPPKGESLGVLCCCGISPWADDHYCHRDIGHATDHFTVWYYGCCGQVVRNDLD